MFRHCGAIPTAAPTAPADPLQFGRAKKPALVCLWAFRRWRLHCLDSASPRRYGPRALAKPLSKHRSDHGSLTSAYAPGTLVPGTDPDAAALLGGLRLRDPAALRHGSRRRHLSPRHHIARARSETLERGLCATLAAAKGWPLRREPQSAAALLPIPGDPQAIAAGYSGALSEIARRHRHRFAPARHPLCRGRLGKPDARRLGVGLGMLVRRHGSLAVHVFSAGRGRR